MSRIVAPDAQKYSPLVGYDLISDTFGLLRRIDRRDRGKCCVVVSDMQFFMLRSQMDRDYPTATNTYNCPQTFQPSTPLPPPNTPRSDMLLLSLLEDFSSVLVAFAHYTKSVTWVGESMRLSGDLDIKSSSPIRLLSLLYRYGWFVASCEGCWRHISTNCVGAGCRLNYFY